MTVTAMREIKFRGKRLDNGEWVYGCYLEFEHNYDKSHKHYAIMPMPILEHPPANQTETFFEVDPVTVGQLLHYIDDNEVYEGDILHIEIHDHWTKQVIASGNEVVKIQDCKIGVQWGFNRNFTRLTGFCNTSMKVIGNRWDNPELLQVEVR